MDSFFADRFTVKVFFVSSSEYPEIQDNSAFRMKNNNDKTVSMHVPVPFLSGLLYSHSVLTA